MILHTSTTSVTVGKPQNHHTSKQRTELPPPPHRCSTLLCFMFARQVIKSSPQNTRSHQSSKNQSAKVEPWLVSRMAGPSRSSTSVAPSIRVFGSSESYAPWYSAYSAGRDKGVTAGAPWGPCRVLACCAFRPCPRTRDGSDIIYIATVCSVRGMSLFEEPSPLLPARRRENQV